MANPNPLPPPEHSRFKPGESGNPGGMAKGSRNRLNATFLKDLADDFQAHGKAAIKEAREKDPMGYIKAIVALQPKQIEETRPLDDISDAQLLAGIDHLRAEIAGRPRSGAGEETVGTPTH